MVTEPVIGFFPISLKFHILCALTPVQRLLQIALFGLRRTREGEHVLLEERKRHSNPLARSTLQCKRRLLVFCR